MSDPNNDLDFSQVKTLPLASRPCKVQRGDYAQEIQAGKTVAQFLEGLPKQLKGVELRAFIDLWAESIKGSKPVIALCGAHVLKVGLGPLLIQAMEKGWINALAFHGAGAVHDFELAYQGATSEDVAKGLEDG